VIAHHASYAHSHPHGGWLAIAAYVVVLGLILAAGLYIRKR